MAGRRDQNFFEKKSVFLWSFAEKTWIKGMRDCGAIIRMAVSCTCPDGWTRKFFEFFSENRGQFAPLPSSNLDREFVCESGKLNIRSMKMAVRRGNSRIGHFHLFSRKMEKSLSVCEKITNIRLGKFFEKSWNVSRFFAYVLGAEMRSRIFSGKIRFFTERLPKNFEYKVWKSSSRGTRGPGLSFVFFGKKAVFYWAFSKKTE